VAFTKDEKLKERVELVSLIDMIFILLVFFLVTSFVIRLPMQEKGMYVPTPEYSLGRAQMIIQFIDENHIFWMDESVSNTVEEIEESFGYLSVESLRDKILKELIEKNTITNEQLNDKINQLLVLADQDMSLKFFVLIRCPNDIPYFRVIDIIAKLSNTNYRNIKYGCTGGDIKGIKECKRIYTVYENDEQGKRRKNIRIDF